MIGQNLIREKIQKNKDEGTLPHFLIIVGAKGSGKKTLLKEMFDGVYPENIKVESIRKLRDMAQQMHDTTFIMPDVDTMSGSAKSALLKMVEECPNGNYFIMTVVDINNASPTLRSRAFVYRMGVYTPDDIAEYIETTFHPTEKDAEKVELIHRLAETPGEVNMLWSYDTQAFYDFTKLAFEHISTVGGANAFKIADRLSMKDDDGKYDITLFLKQFSQLCIDQVHNHNTGDLEDIGYIVKYSQGCSIASKYIKKSRIAGINKQFLIDSWILEMRRVWR